MSLQPSNPAPDSVTHPWMQGRFADCPCMTDVLRIQTFLAGHTACGNLPGVRLDWAHLPVAAHAGALEVVLQTHLFAGFPRMINAFATIHEDMHDSTHHKQGPIDVGQPDAGEAPASAWYPAGEALCRQIYGGAYDNLRRSMHRMHPAMDRWMVETGYGRVLSRPGLTPRDRELCVIGVLAGQNVPRQLESHLRGALKVGAEVEACAAVLDHTESIWGPEAHAEAQDVWRKVRPSTTRTT